MKLFKYRGRKIRARDKNLVFYTYLLYLIPLSLAIIGISYFREFKSIDYYALSLQDISNISLDIKHLVLTLLFVVITCVVLIYVYRRYKYDYHQQLVHRQKISRMILENGWYEKSKVTSSSFFKDMPSSKEKEKIVSFPKIYYQLKDGLVHIEVEIVLGKYQDQLLHLEKKLESGFFCELVDKELKDSFVKYTLLYDTIANRISIDDVVASNGSIRLMKNIYWNYDSLPHLLLAGGTGGGKTYFLLTLIQALSETNANLYILDPKNSDLADLKGMLPHVYSKKDDMIACLNDFYEAMLLRNETMKDHPDYKTGENYAYLGLEANFLVFDEYVAFIDMIDRESQEVISKIKQIVMLGRQSGFFLILACQRPDAKYLGEGIRDNFNCRIALGRMSELGLGMVFGDTQKDFYLKPIKGRGYIDMGINVISEFYTPLVPKGYDFLDEIEKIIIVKKGEQINQASKMPPNEEKM